MVKIAIDIMGGDNAPEAIVDGAIKAVEEDSSIELLLYGTKGSYNGNHSNIQFIEVSEKIESDDDPVKSVRRKKDSSLVRACLAVKNNEADAVISAGNTGALLSSGLFNIGRINGIERPAIASILPSTNQKGMMLLDMGANSENKSKHLYQFAMMAEVYMSKIVGRNQPTVRLINNGSEENKGNDLTRDTYQLLSSSNLNFQGNLEAREILEGAVDIAVTDGFTGNVILKTIEGTAKSLMSELKNALTSSTKNKIGGLLIKNDIQKVKDLLDYRQYGGAPLLGLEGHVLKAHGSSDALAIKNAVIQGKKMAESNIIEEIKIKLGE